LKRVRIVADQPHAAHLRVFDADTGEEVYCQRVDIHPIRFGPGGSPLITASLEVQATLDIAAVAGTVERIVTPTFTPAAADDDGGGGQ